MRKTLFATAAVAISILLQAPCSVAQTAATDDTVFRQFGGKEGIASVMNDFIPLLLADARIKEVFRDVDMDRLAALLAEQFCELTGGPCKYSGKDMKTIHADLKITNAQFNALAEDLQVAMEKHQVPSSAQNKLIAKLAPMQRMVVTK